VTSPRFRSEGTLCVVYGAALGNSGGTGVYTFRLLRGLAELACDDVKVALPGSITTPAAALAFPATGGPRKALAELWGIPAMVRAAAPRLVHLPAFAGRVPRGVPSIVTVHDLAFLAGPSWFPRIKALYYRLHFPPAARRAELVIVDSDFSGREAVRLLGIDPGRIRRVYLSAPAASASGEAFRSSCAIEGEYVLSVGTIEPRKNIDALLDAWQAVRKRRPGLTLAVAGRWGWGDRSLLRKLRASPGVVWTGPLGPGLLASAYAGARLLAYVSTYEGFGLPPLEAASFGVPSVIGPAASLSEIYGGVAASVSGPGPGSISEAILTALDRDSDAGALREFASGFSLPRMAGETLAVYREAAG